VLNNKSGVSNIISVYNSSQIMYNRYGSNYVYTQQPKEKKIKR